MRGVRRTPVDARIGGSEQRRTIIALPQVRDGEEVAVCLTAERTEPEAVAERSPFMPAPPGGDKKKK